MARCDVCGNDYDKAFTVNRGGQTMTFDSFECAIQAMAPKCAHCDCRIIGHGLEADGRIYCCAHCARHAGAHGLSDREDGAGAMDHKKGRQRERASAANKPATKKSARNRSWEPGEKGHGREGLSKGYGGSKGPGVGPSGPDDTQD